MKAERSSIQTSRTFDDYQHPIFDEMVYLNVSDYRGRAVGSHNTIRVVTYTANEEQLPSAADALGWVCPGSYYHAHVHKTKAGKEFGGTPEGAMFTTMEEALRYIAERGAGITVDTMKDNVKRGKKLDI